MDLATTLAFILLIGAVILAVVSVLAYLLYRQSTAPTDRPPESMPAPSLDVPAPTSAPMRPLPAPTPSSADGASTALPEPACSPDRPEHASAGAPPNGLLFLEYDGETFVPVRPNHAEPTDRPTQETRPAAYRTNGFAWR